MEAINCMKNPSYTQVDVTYSRNARNTNFLSKSHVHQKAKEDISYTTSHYSFQNLQSLKKRTRERLNCISFQASVTTVSMKKGETMITSVSLPALDIILVNHSMQKFLVYETTRTFLNPSLPNLYLSKPQNIIKLVAVPTMKGSISSRVKK